MERAADVMQWVSLGVYLILAWATLSRWRSTRQAPAGWAAATFSSLAVVIAVAMALPDDDVNVSVARGLIVTLALFPYLLFRFTASIVRPAPVLRRLAQGLTATVALATLVVPYFPRPEEARPSWYAAYTLLFLVQWIYLFSVVGLRLFLAGRGKPTVVRRRVRWMAAGAAGMNIAVIISAVAPSSTATPAHLTGQAIGLLAGLALLIGLAPPRILRNEWRRAESGQTQAMMMALLRAEETQVVADAVLPFAAQMIGARAMALVEPGGRVLGTIGVTPDVIAAELSDPDPHARLAGRVVSFDGRFGCLIAWTDPYTPFFAPDDVEAVHAMGAVADIVLERCAKVAYERRFIANAAHELRTPLTTLSGLSVTLAQRRQQMGEAEIAECFRALERQGDRTRVLIENLLDLAQLEHGTPDINPHALRIAEVAERVRELAPPPEGRALVIDVDQSVTVLADAPRLEQVLVNLVTNAYRYGGDTVTVQAYNDVGGVLVVVADDGPGVPSEIVPQLFEPFGRGSVGSNQGSGLGLAIVRRLVTAHGGDVWYEPARPRGARFTIRLPAAA